MSRYSPSGIAWGRVPEQGGERAFQTGLAMGNVVGQSYMKARAESRAAERQAWEDELDERRYQDTQRRLTKTEERIANEAHLNRLRQGAMDAAAGLLQIPEGDERLTEQLADPDDPVVKAPRYRPLGGGYYEDVERSPAYTQRRDAAKLRRAAEGTGVDPDLAGTLGANWFGQRLNQEDQQAHARAMARESQANARELQGLRSSGGSTSSGRMPPMAVVNAMGNNDTIYGLAQQAAQLAEQSPGAVGTSGFVPEVVRGLGTGPTGPNALGRAMSALPGVNREVFTPGATRLWAVISDLMSRQLLERSGAAVTVSEFGRIKPYVPRRSDPPEVLRDKLQNIMRVIEEESEFTRMNYGPETGFAPVRTRNIPNPPGAAVGGAPDPTGGFLNRFTVTPRGGGY